jgi:3',5'-nucleoside bisphosphate phosphatase
VSPGDRPAQRSVRIDLHTHTTCSDGTDTPAELMAAAAAAGLDAVAITDHDTTAGWAAAEAVRPAGLRLVRGAELSCTSPDGNGRDISVHLLGYLFDPDHPAMLDEQRRLREQRRVRLARMAELMAADGYPVGDVLGGLSPDAAPGRPHLAQALVEAGVVGSVGEAFDRLLSNRSPYYVRRVDTPVEDAIRLVDAAGGVCVFAHPFARRRGYVVEPSVLVSLAAAGLGGIEVDHPDHAPADRALAAELAASLDLIPTGSSDYHGANKSTPLGCELTSPESLERLVTAAHGVPVLAG